MTMQQLISHSLDYLQNGGIVMIPIILCSLALWVLGLERLLVFRQAEHDDLDLATTLTMIRRGDAGPIKPGLRRDLVRFMVAEQTGCATLSQGLLHQYRLRQQPLLMQYIGIITILTAIAPLLGLLGTVNGMITTFDVIALFGTGNAKAMAGGISQSLITTQSGLSVAIPGMFLGVIIHRRAQRLSDRLDETISTLQRGLRDTS